MMTISALRCSIFFFFCIVVSANIPQRYPYLLSCVETGCVSEFCADFRRHHPRCASVRSRHMTGEWVYGGSSWHHAGSEWHSSAGESGFRKHIKVKCILVQRKQKLHPCLNYAVHSLSGNVCHNILYCYQGMTEDDVKYEWQ